MAQVWAREDIAGIAPEVIGFDGKLVNYGSNLFIGKNDFTDLKNFRYFKGGIGTRLGMAAYTSGAEPNANEIVKVIPYQNDNTFYLMSASARENTGTTYYRVDTGAFSSTSSYWTSGTTSTPITSAVVRDTLAVGDGSGVWVWSGETTYPLALLVQSLPTTGTTVTVYTNYSNWITDGSSHTVASGSTVYVGYTRPFVGFQADKDDTIRTDSAFQSSTTEFFKGGQMYYWLQYTVSTGGSTFELPRIKTNPRALGTSWDGQDYQLAYAALLQKTGVSEFKDFTLSVAYKSENTYMDISEMQSGGTIYFGFPYRPRHVKIHIPDKYANTAAASVSGYYWNGSGLSLVTPFADGTSYGGKCFAQTGLLEFDRQTNWEKRTYGSNDVSLYYLALKVSGTLSNYTRIFYVTAIPDYDSPNDEKYTGVAEWNDRLVLYNGRTLNKVLISPIGQPDCFIGSDSVHTFRNYTIGKKEKRMWVGTVGDSMLMLNETENWVMEGKTPATYTKKQLSGTVACFAPESVAKVDMENGSLVIYQGRDGVYALSFGISLTSLNLRGSSVKLSDDIGAYWESGNTKEISASMASKSRGWYDKANEEYNLLVAAGSGATRFTERLVYSKVQKKWSVFTVDPSLLLSCGSYDTRSTGEKLHLGGGYSGTIYTLESGTSDVSKAIVSDFTRKPASLGDREGTMNELRALAFRFQLPDSAGTLSGSTIYLTSSQESSAVIGQIGWNFTDLGFDSLSLLEWVDESKGYMHQVRGRFPGRINLYKQLIWSRPAPWKMRTGYVLYDEEVGIGRLLLE